MGYNLLFFFALQWIVFIIIKLALCSLSPSPNMCYLAYPAGTTISGDLVVYDAIQMQKVCIISAHKSALSCIQFNSSGKLIATASDKVN